MLSKKQEDFFNLMVNCYKETKEFPSIGMLKKRSHYKSYNSIYKYMEQLEKKDYIKFDKERKQILYMKDCLENNSVLNIPVINEKRFLTFPSYLLKENKDYIAFKLHNNKLNSYCLKNGDVLIIEKTIHNLNNKLVLACIENKYYILKYIKKDGFIHLINDKDFFVLTSFETIIGIVVSMVRSSMD